MEYNGFEKYIHYTSWVVLFVFVLCIAVFGKSAGKSFHPIFNSLHKLSLVGHSLLAIILILLICVFIWNRYVKNIEMEPFQNQKDEIVARIDNMKAKYHPSSASARQEPSGVYDPSIEGFQDASPNAKKDGAPSDSSSASTALTTNQVDKEHVKAVTSALTKTDKEVEEEEAKSATGTLFKTGQMPSENAAGPKLDAGKTIMKAMESFDSNTVNAMTDDTKKLLETQKSLMSMLTQMRPVLADGKELLQTFSGMFGGNMNGNGSGMQFKL